MLKSSMQFFIITISTVFFRYKTVKCYKPLRSETCLQT